MTELRVGTSERICVLFALALLTVTPLFHAPVAWAGVAGMAACAVLSLIERWPSAARLSIVGASCELFVYLPTGIRWPLTFLLGLAVLPIAARFTPWLRPAFPWLRRGALDRSTVALIAGVVVVSATALVLWFVLLHPDVSDLRRQLPSMPVWALPFVALGFATVNAMAEEAVYRGVVFEALDATLGAGISTIVLQAVAFGCLHLYGFPRGAVGVVLAAIYGLMLGVVRRRAGGMLAPFIAHVFADVTIVTILATRL